MNAAARTTLRDKLHALVDEIADAIETGSEEWVDQNKSPLGRRRHLELVRKGVLEGSREGRLVLVRRSDIERYLLKKKVVVPKPVDETADEEREVAKVLTMLGQKRRAG